VIGSNRSFEKANYLILNAEKDQTHRKLFFGFPMTAMSPMARDHGDLLLQSNVLFSAA
jgi:hypothetical protein